MRSDQNPAINWITKSDFMEWCRCGYAYSMRRAGLVTTRFGSGEPERESDGWPDWVNSLFTQNGWILRNEDTPVIRNPKLGIAGRPAGIDPANGAMTPILVFPYERVSTKTGRIESVLPEVDLWDRWALAFYWLLLAPQRTQSDAESVGYVVLPGASVKQYPLNADLAAVQFGIEKARQATQALSPYSCGECDICKTRSTHRLQIAREQRSLAVVRGISFRQALGLERARIDTHDALMRADPREVSQVLHVPEENVNALKTMASAVAAESHIVLKKPEELPDPANMIVLDTEHGMWWKSTGGWVWLIGLRVYRDGEYEDHILWAGDQSIDEYRNLEEIA